MAPDTFTETSSRGYGSRIVDSIKGVIFGIIMFLGSFVILWWNEGNLASEKTAFKEMEKVMMEGDVKKSFPELTGKLLHLVGDLTTTEELGDETYLKAGPYLVLDRQVEMYQWVESEHSETKKKLGGGEETVKTYTYDKKWHRGRVNSNEFRHPEGHMNPELPVDETTMRVSESSFGVFSGQSLVERISASEELRLTPALMLESDTLLEGNKVSIKKTPNSKVLELGDAHVSYQVVRPGTFSVLAQQVSQNELGEFTASNGKTKYLVQAGSHSAQELLADARAEAGMIAWILRAVGFIVMWIGLGLLLGPISTILDVVPFLGSIGRGAIGLVTGLIAFALSLVTIIVSMVVHNFIALLVVAALGIVGTAFWLKRGSKKQQQQQAVAA